MIKQPIAILPIFKLSNRDEAAPPPYAGSAGKSFTLISSLLDQLKVSGYRKVYITKSKVGFRKVTTIRNIPNETSE